MIRGPEADGPAPAAVPRSVTVYTAALAVVALTTVALAAGDPTPIHWFSSGTLLVTLVVAGGLKLRFHHGRDVQALDVFDAVLAPAVFAMPAPLTVAAVALAKLVTEGWTGVDPVKVRFNVAQWAAAAGAGSLVFYVGGGAPVPTAANIALLGLAMVVVSVVNHLAVVGVLRLTGSRNLRQVLRESAPVVVRGWVVGGLLNLAVGLLFVAAWSALPWVTPLFLVPLGLLHWANRNYAEARADRSRLSGLQRATGTLLQQVDPRTAVDAFLAEVRATFEVDVVELLWFTAPEQVAGRRCAPAGVDTWSLTSAAVAPARSELEAVVASASRIAVGPVGRAVGVLTGGVECQDGLVAPVRQDQRVVGYLCVRHRLGLHGFADGELAVLDVLAAELANAWAKGELLDTMLDERRQLAEIIDHSSEGIATVSRHGEVLSWNPGFVRLSGLGEVDIRSEGGLDLLHARDRAGRAVPLRRWADGGELPTDLEIDSPDGPRWLACSYSYASDAGRAADRLHDGTQRADRLIVIARDVTATRQLEQAESELQQAAARLQAVKESEERVQALLRNASDVVVVVDGSGVVTYSSQGDVSRSSLTAPRPGQPWLDLVHPDDHDAVRALLDPDHVVAGTTVEAEHRVASGNGGWRSVTTVATNLVGHAPVDGVVLNTSDITERKRAEALLSAETAILGLIAREEALDEVVRRIVAGVEDQLPGCRAAMVVLHDGRPEMAVGPDVSALERAGLAARVLEDCGAGTDHRLPTGACHAYGDSSAQWELHQLTGSDGTALGALCLRRLSPGDGGCERMLDVFAGLAVVAVERQRSRAELTRRATHDSLTGLPNRSMLVDHLTMALARGHRSRSWVAALYVDLDRFKEVNDTFGHDVGDQVLVEVGHRMAGVVRPGDTVARLGGDEFAVVCEGLGHPNEAADVAERLRRALSEPLVFAGHRLVLPPSIGVAVAGGGGNAHELLERADAAMYRAKRSGGDRWEVTELLTRMP